MGLAGSFSLDIGFRPYTLGSRLGQPLALRGPRGGVVLWRDRHTGSASTRLATPD